MTAIEIVEGDITTLEVDAIVNAANSELLGGGGVDGAIHRAGGPDILAECRKLRKSTYPDGLPAGQAVSTTAGNMPSRWVIHTVGPVYSDTEDRSETLRSAYIASLAAADIVGAHHVAFPLVSAGVYGWPRKDAVDQAITAIESAVTHVTTVTMVAYDHDVAELLRARLAESA
ncbi:O-acetyl-ADP-ribose deacetylase [Actinomycetes bacterium M1A6_2h]